MPDKLRWKHTRLRWGALVVAVAGGALAASLALVDRGEAAGTNICSQASPTTRPDCLVVAALPVQVTLGGNALGFVKFANQANSTAPHTMLQLTAPAGITLASASASLNGAALPASACTISGQTATCDIGTVPGRGIAKAFAQGTVTAALANATWQGTVRYAEGNNNTGSVNDTYSWQSNAVTSYSGDSVGGTCASPSSTQTFTTTLGQQSTTLTAPGAAAKDLPCVPLALGVRAKLDKENEAVCGGAPCRSDISFAFVPELVGGGTAAVSVTIPTTNLPNGSWKSIPLYEFPGDDPSQLVHGIALQACPAFGSASSCIVGMTQLNAGGTKYIRWDLRVKGSAVDPRYGG